jgi:hypothetical protein
VTALPRTPYWVAYNDRLHKYVVIESATGLIVAESDDHGAAKEEAARLTREAVSS